MAFVAWNDSFNVNVSDIDMQHRKLIGMINDLNDAMRHGKGKDILGRIIDGLVNYAGVHFRTEEAYFDRFGYPESRSHKIEHSSFTKEVADFKSKFDAGKLALSVEVMNFLGNWLQNHIKGVDKKYGPFLNEHGLK
jgi:hemerythrin